jgi:outer membrane protein assembly factor BamE (lipoprotein component of BamABCDE complex)
MKRRRVVLLGAGVLALLACDLAIWATLPRPGITKGNYGRLKEGMTRQEVQDILGCPPGDYNGTVRDREYAYAFLSHAITLSSPKQEFWIGERVAVMAEFDQQGKLFQKGLYEFPGRGILTHLRRLLGL